MSDSPDAPSEQLRESERTPSYEGLLARLAEFEQQHAALLQAVAARRESEAEYRQLFANMQEGFAFPVEVSSSGATIDVTRTLISVVRDITERKRAEDALREANLQLAEADRSKNNFMAVLSHELRNPLTPIRNSLYILDRATPGSEQARRSSTDKWGTCRALSMTYSM